MFKILIANRGEIAVRIIAAVRELGLRSIAVHSTADRESLHVALADESVCIGPSSLADSYLHLGHLISAAEITGADAVHPGYGLLAERARFAEVVSECGLIWIGPKAATIRRMGDKVEARKAARAVGVPVLPGSEEMLADAEMARRLAGHVGFPVMLKAAGGGGGRGMRVVETRDDVETQFLIAQAEASAAFGDSRLYLERYLEAPRHIEVQVLGDHTGRVVHLGERECSIQRRHQKLLEESPSPALDEKSRSRITAAAVTLAESIGYENAGTVEFLLDENGKFFFMEMNSRIQVEHPVTEMVTGVDLVKEQIRLAAGESLRMTTSPEPSGWAVECRINAEHPRSFRPSPGRIETLRLPGGPGVRVDTHVFEGYTFPPFYDSLLGKVIGHGASRSEAIARTRRALDFLDIGGIDTTVDLHREILRDDDFVAGRLSTRFMERFSSEG